MDLAGGSTRKHFALVGPLFWQAACHIGEGPVGGQTFGDHLCDHVGGEEGQRNGGADGAHMLSLAPGNDVDALGCSRCQFRKPASACHDGMGQMQAAAIVLHRRAPSLCWCPFNNQVSRFVVCRRPGNSQSEVCRLGFDRLASVVPLQWEMGDAIRLEVAFDLQFEPIRINIDPPEEVRNQGRVVPWL